MKKNLFRICKEYFTFNTDVNSYIEGIDYDIKNIFSKKQVEFFIRYNNENIDLIALEYNLRKKDKNNIFSFVFLRLSSLAETTTENQDKYVNKSKAGIFKIFTFLSITAINTIIYKIKGFTLKSKIQEYLDA